MNAPSQMAPGARVVGVDALRGIAATMVMAFHYSTRFGQLHGPWPGLGFTFESGRLGVQLFFMISGFVIFMTLDRATHPSEFIVSRFSRLYPVFWAAVLLTGGVELSFHLLGQQYGWSTVLLNLLMVQGLFQVPDIDGAYWTLQVEVLFYVCMLALWLYRGLANFRPVLGVWLALALVHASLPAMLGVRVPNVVNEFLVLEYIPWFAMGMILFMRGQSRQDVVDLALYALALLCIALGHSVQLMLVTVGFSALLTLAVQRPPRLLLARPLVWMGAISYPFYLVHENLGYSLMLLTAQWGATPWVSVGCALVMALVLAWTLHLLIEKPAMAGIRTWYRLRFPAERRVLSTSGRSRWRVALALAVVVLLIGNRLALMR